MGVPRPVTNSMGESTPFCLRMASHSSSAPHITSSKTTILSPLSVLGGHSQKPLPRSVTSSPRGQSAFLESGIRCNWWSITKARLPFSVVSISPTARFVGASERTQVSASPPRPVLTSLLTWKMASTRSRLSRSLASFILAMCSGVA